MLELCRACLQPAVKTFTSDIDDMLNDARNLCVLPGRKLNSQASHGGRFHILAGTTDVAGNDGAETSGDEDGDQEGDHKHWLHTPNATKGV